MTRYQSTTRVTGAPLLLLCAAFLALSGIEASCTQQTIIKKKNQTADVGSDPEGTLPAEDLEGGTGETPPDPEDATIGGEEVATQADTGATTQEDGATVGGSDTTAPQDLVEGKPDTTAPAGDTAGTKDGTTPEDAAPKEDSGTLVEDAGSPPEDAGSAPPDVPKWDGGDKPPTCVDLDADGYGKGCPAGPDCDDKNPYFHEKCPNCFAGAFPGCPCTGTVVDCYSGDWTLLGKGECTNGKQTCTNGYWSGCVGEMLPQPEVCDDKDNDCDGVTDEAMLLSACGNCDLSCTVEAKGPDDGQPFNPNKQNASGVGTNDKGYLILDQTQINLAFIWIANSGEGTISKLDTKTGWEMGRYKICSDPSRTSVDLLGDVWVGCRGDGGVAKIMIAKEMCIDKNANGVIDTSGDADGNHVITPNEMVPNDECVKFVVYPNGSTIARAMGVDKDNNVWVGFWSSNTIMRLAAQDGSTLDSIGIGCNPYGLVIDQKGIIWVSGRGCGKLLRIDPATKQVSSYQPPWCYEPYGISVDSFGKVWSANCCCSDAVYRFDPDTSQWSKVGTNSRPRGVAGSNDGMIYVANDTSNGFTKVNAQTLQNAGFGSAGGGAFPVGVAIDYEGFVWLVNQSSNNASKINPKTMQAVGVYPVGVAPYTYSDMTGYALNNFTAPQGHYSTTFGFDSYRSIWQSIDVVADTPPGTSLKLRFRVAMTKDALVTATWFGPYGPFPPEKFPYTIANIDGLNGDYMQVEVTLISNDKKATPVVKSIKVSYKALPK